MINPNELRIGNLVLVDRLDDYEPWETIVEEIEPYQITVALLPRGGTRVKPDEIEAIALTPEWLEKFGASKEDSGYEIADTFVFKKNYYRDATGNYKGFILNFKVGEGSRVFTRIFEYVHQLQNLYFALTGEELEIKNEKL